MSETSGPRIFYLKSTSWLSVCELCEVNFIVRYLSDFIRKQERAPSTSDSIFSRSELLWLITNTMVIHIRGVISRQHCSIRPFVYTLVINFFIEPDTHMSLELTICTSYRAFITGVSWFTFQYLEYWSFERNFVNSFTIVPLRQLCIQCQIITTRCLVLYNEKKGPLVPKAPQEVRRWQLTC